MTENTAIALIGVSWLASATAVTITRAVLTYRTGKRNAELKAADRKANGGQP